MAKRILITGASGFIGSHIAEEALRQGMEVWCAVRKTTSRQYLSDERLHFIELNLGSKEQMVTALADLKPNYVVHAAGATKCRNKSDFERINTEGTKNLVEALETTTPDLERLVFISSLSVFGAIHEEQPYTEIKDTDTPRPNTAYGQSKLKAEQWMQGCQRCDSNDGNDEKGCTLPYIILRPTGVYGPREKDYFLMVKSIAQHTDFAAGYKPQDITFVYVDDVVQAVFKAIAAPEQCLGKAYFLSDGEVYSSVDFSDLILKELGNPWCLRLRVPLWVLRLVTFCGEYWGHLTNTMSALNNDKYNILCQRNWRCDISPARCDLGYEPKVKLAEGVRRSIKWYKENKWI